MTDYVATVTFTADHATGADIVFRTCRRAAELTRRAFPGVEVLVTRRELVVVVEGPPDAVKGVVMVAAAEWKRRTGCELFNPHTGKA